MSHFLRVYLTLAIALLSTYSASAQSMGCEQVTQAALSKLVPLLRDNNFQEIEQTLQTIEASCGSREITQRLHILGLIIQKQSSENAIRTYLGQGLDNVLMTRLDDAAEENYESLYQRQKESYQYVPLRHAIDSLVQVKASAVLGSDMYTLHDLEEAILLLFSDHINSYLMLMQKEKPVSRTERLQQVEIDKGGYGFAILGGLYTPMNATSPIFKRNPIFGMSVMSPLWNDWVFDGFFKFRLGSNNRDFEYQLYDDVEIVNSPASYMIGASVGYKFLDLGRFLMLAKAGIAFETVSTGLTETTYWDYYNASTRFHNVNTYNLSTGISAMQHLSGRTFVGIQAQYHHSPYNIDRRLITPIASDYVSFELFFKF